MSTKRLRHASDEHGKSESKRHKGHKSHKNKKDRKESKRQSCESGEEWVEASNRKSGPVVKRDDWMTLASQASESHPIVKPVGSTGNEKVRSNSFIIMTTPL